MAEPLDIQKYEFVSMPVKEEWGALVREDSPFLSKSVITPQDLVGIPLISAVGNIAESNLGKWFGPELSKANVVAKGDLLYNEAMLANSKVGVVLAMRLNCRYEGLHFIPLSPKLEGSTALAWKKEQVFSPAVAAFLEFAKKYVTGMSHDDR